MKKFLFALLFVSIFSQAQVKFEKTLAATFEQAKAQNKPVFIKYYNSECSVCKEFQKLLETDKAVADFYNANFINYAMNTLDNKDPKEVLLLTSANLNFESVPMALFFDENGSFMHYSSVKVNSEYVIAIGNMALNTNFNTAALPARYKKGDRTVRTLYAYADYLVVTKNTVLLNQVAQDLFVAFNKEELPTKKSYIVLKNVVQSSENGFFQYWITNLDKLQGFETGFSEGVEKEVLVNIVLKELAASSPKNWSKAKKEIYKSYIIKLGMTDNPEDFFQ